ncbi:hypothetical protein PINS_up008137 [Pythium insidiosum]|nr:hypothetical protein PINS_up008137 [Pythium insidiosum]
MKYMQSHKTISEFLDRCEKENIELPENPYDAMMEVSTALKATEGKEKVIAFMSRLSKLNTADRCLCVKIAMERLKKKFGVVGNKRSQSEPHQEQGNGHDVESDDENMPHHKRIKLAEEAGEEPAVCSENQKIVDAFIKYGVSQLEKGHTGKGVTHLRAAKEIRMFDKPIKSGYDARQVGYVGDKMAQQVDQVLRDGEVKDDSPDLNVSKDYDHNHPNIVGDIRDKPARGADNQKIVDVLADYGEYQLKYGNTGKGTSHLRAAKEIHSADIVIDSGYTAKANIGYIGDVIADKIDQILKHGKIVHDTDYSGSSSQRVRGDPAPIVRDLMERPAKKKENQKIVDALRDYGDAHLRGGYRGKGISHLRAAASIRNSDIVIKNAGDATKIDMVGDAVARKIDQILRQGHADSDEDYVEGEEEEYEDEDVEDEEEHFGPRHSGGTMPPLVEDVRSTSAKCPENQKIVDSLADFGEKQLQERHTGRGVTFLRAAKQLSQSSEVIKSANQAKKIGMVGDKVAQLIEKTLKQSK